MLEPLSIVGFVTGSLAFIMTIRNAISKVVDDIDEFRRHWESVMDMALRLTRISQKLLAWQIRWHLDEGHPSSLPEAYWGATGSEQIFWFLGHVYRKAVSVQHQFNEQAAAGVDYSMCKTKEVPASELWDDEKRVEQKLERQRREFNRASSARGRASKSLFSTLKKHVESLQRSVDDLDTCSKDSFFIENGIAREEDWEINRDKISIKFHLLQLATQNAQDSAAIRDLLLEAGDCRLELYLNHKTDASNRETILVSASQHGSLTHHFRLSKACESSGRQVDFSCSVLRDDIEIDRSYGQNNTLFSSTANDLLAQQCPKPAHLHFQRDRKIFAMQEFMWNGDQPGDETHCLRTYLAARCASTNFQLHEDFSSEERHRLAYELAEWMLLFLHTRWFSDLCSCCIARVQSPDLIINFRATVSPIQYHIGSESGRLESKKQWCQEELSGMHVRRLGIVLAEIAFGYPVPDVALNPRKGIELDQNFTDDTPVLHRREINKKIKDTMGVDYMRVVDYCLTCDRNAEDMDAQEVENFYKHVVRPLYTYYEELTVKMAENFRTTRANGRARRAERRLGIRLPIS